MPTRALMSKIPLAGPTPVRRPSAPEPAAGFPEMGRLWTVANALSISRAVLVVPIAVLVYHGGPVGPMFGLIGLAIATDWFDGRVARATDTVSEWGKVLDAIADKLAAAAVTVALLTRPDLAGPTLPLWFVVLAVSRDAILAIGGLIQTRRLGRFTSSLWSGKVAVSALSVTVVVALLGEPFATPRVMEALIGLTAAVMAYSIVKYSIRFVAIARHGAEALDTDGTTLKPEHGVLKPGRP